jgi:nitroreductase
MGGQEMLKDLVVKNRSYRRFYEEESISWKVLEELIDLARLSPCGANLQALKYILSNEREANEQIFKALKWAGYLTDWAGPVEGERPAGYIVMLGDTEIKRDFACDSGIASQSILLGATEEGLGGCILASIDREKIRSIFNIPSNYEVLLVIALGKPKEEVVIEELKEGESVKYWRDEKAIHHVPKRKLEEIILDR